MRRLNELLDVKRALCYVAPLPSVIPELAPNHPRSKDRMTPLNFAMELVRSYGNSPQRHTARRFPARLGYQDRSSSFLAR